VLHEHLIDGRLAEVGIEGRAAQREERVERGLKLRVVLVSVLDLVEQALRQVRNLLAEVLDGVLEVFVLRLLVG
jgi:hypothetical protein